MTHAPDHITSTAPKQIYLDLGDCAHLIKPEETFATYAQGEVTWSAGNDSGVGIPYVRADLAAPTSPASGALPADFEPWLRTVCITAPPPQAYDLAKQAWAQGMERGAALASREASAAPLTNAAQTALDAYEDWFESTTGACNYIGPIDEEMIALRRALASPQVAPALSLNTPLESECRTISGFLSDVMTTAGLVEHGKQCKSLAVRVSKACMELRGLVYGATPVQVAPTSGPTAYVPVHPRNGPLWMDAFPAGKDVSESRSSSYPVMALYTAPVAPQDDARDAAEALTDEEIADEVVQRVCEYDDRTSPEDWPDALLITGEELKAEVLRALEDRRASPTPAASGAASLTDEQIVALWAECETPTEANGYTTGFFPFARALLALASPQVAPISRGDVLSDVREWFAATGAVPKGGSWEAEIESMVAAAYDIGRASAAAPAPVAPQDDARDAADPLQGAADWLKEALTPCTPYDIGGRLLIGYNRALRLFHATPAAKPTEPTLPTQGEQSHD